MKLIKLGMVLILPTYLLADMPLLKTGQTKCYNNTVEITCPTEGEEFYGQDAQYASIVGTERSYTRDPATGIVTDNATGLQWQDNVAPVQKQWVTIDNYNAENYYDTTGDTAITYCATLSLDGGEWRLPTIKELESLTDKSRVNPALFMETYDVIPNNGFVYIGEDSYWSSSSSVLNTRSAWVVEFNYGYVPTHSKNGNLNVRCVRNKVLNSTVYSSCKEQLVNEPSSVDGVYSIDPDGNGPLYLFNVYCDMTTDGGGWIDVHKTFQYVSSNLTYRHLFFYDINLIGTPVANNDGFFIKYAANGNAVGIYLDPFLNNSYNEIKMNWVLQGSDDGYRCTSSNWIPLNGPGYDGGYNAYLASCPPGKTCIQGTPVEYKDEPASSTYFSDSLSSDVLLVWSGSAATTTLTGNCAKSPLIPTNDVALWFSELKMR